MASDDFRSWLDNMRALGYGEGEIRQSLQEKGWTERQIDELIRPAAPEAVSVPPPPGVGAAELPPPQPVAQVLVAPPVSAAPIGPPAPPAPGAYVPSPAVRPVTPPTGSSGLATWSLVMGLVSLFLFPTSPVSGPLAIIFGAVSISKRRPGQGMSVAGIVMGILALIMLPFWLIMGMGAWTSYKVIGNEAFRTYSQDWKGWGSGSSEDQPATPEAGQEDDREGACLSNERRLMAAMKMYSADYDSCTPDAAAWPEAIQVYLGDEDPWRCPADQRDSVQEQGGIATSYTMYEPMGGTYLSSFKSGGLTKAYVLFDGAVIAGEGDAAGFRHRDGLNLGYADGHCAWTPKLVFLNPPE